MQVVQIAEYGGPEMLVPERVVRPKARPGECVVRLEYAGVSFADTYMRRGLYPTFPKWPAA